MVLNGRTRDDLDDRERAKEGATDQAVDYSQPTTGARIRELLIRADLTQRAAARELEMDERTMRYYCADDPDRIPPRMVFLALERLVELRRQVGAPADFQQVVKK